MAAATGLPLSDDGELVGTYESGQDARLEAGEGGRSENQSREENDCAGVLDSVLAKAMHSPNSVKLVQL